IPSSQRPLGNYELKRNCVLPRLASGQRAFLHFESVNYFSRASVNGAELGVMGPYVPYEFEMSRVLREGSNAVSVSIADVRPQADGGGKDEIAFCVTPAWEAYSGRVCDVYVESRP